MSKIITLKDRITQESIYPITTTSAVLDRNGKSIEILLTEKSEECPFAEYIQMTSKHKCMFQQGMYSRCNLECNMECKFLSLLPFPSTY